MANLALLEWPENLAISDTPPSDYTPELRGRFQNADWQAMHEHHALPEGWEAMTYPDFLKGRLKMRAAIIRRGYETLA